MSRQVASPPGQTSHIGNTAAIAMTRVVSRPSRRHCWQRYSPGRAQRSPLFHVFEEFIRRILRLPPDRGAEKNEG